MRPEDLLLAPELSSDEVTEFLARYGFADPVAADRNLQLMAEDVTTRLALARMVGKLLEVARETPDPDGALNQFERLLGVVSHPVNFLGFLGETAEALEAVLLICGSSSYASEILIRDPETFSSPSRAAPRRAVRGGDAPGRRCRSALPRRTRGIRANPCPMRIPGHSLDHNGEGCAL